MPAPPFVSRIALVTGASRGIGRAIALALAEAGADVAVNYRERKAEAETTAAAVTGLGRKAGAFGADVSDANAVAAMVASVEKALGPIDILVNNAGVAIRHSIDEITEADFDFTIATNLKSVFLCTQAAWKGMRARGWGRIVNISSVNAIKGQFGQTNYSAAKAGMAGFSKALAQEVVRKGVTVNTISPGYVETDLVRAIRADVRQQIIDSIPMGRLAIPADVGDVCLFLASPLAGYVSGANVLVHGGGEPPPYLDAAAP